MQDLAEAFVGKILKYKQNNTEIRLVFDRYIEGSLKMQTRKKRTSGIEVRYQISDTTNISAVSLKQLLSHIETKQDLTVYLSRYVIQALDQHRIKYVVTYDQASYTNTENTHSTVNTHDHEEADTLIILHCFEIARDDPFTECVVVSPDTDVFLLLVHHYPELPQKLIFRTGRGEELRNINIGSCYESLGVEHAKALLGFHTMTGCDQTGKFNGKSKIFWWNHFINTSGNILHALAELGETYFYLFPTLSLKQT